MHFLAEAAVVGVGLVILGVAMAYLCYRAYNKVPSQKALMCMVGFFFVLGFSFHVIAELAGVNKWYCNNGHSCT